MTSQPGVIYMLHFDQPYKHARHYTGRSESSGFLKVQFAAAGRELAELAVVSAVPGPGRMDVSGRRDCGQVRVARRAMIGLSGMSAQVISK
jgi:hypothetical protein